MYQPARADEYFQFFAVFLLIFCKEFRTMDEVAWLKCHPGPQWLRPPSLKSRRFFCAGPGGQIGIFPLFASELMALAAPSSYPIGIFPGMTAS